MEGGGGVALTLLLRYEIFPVLFTLRMRTSGPGSSSSRLTCSSSMVVWWLYVESERKQEIDKLLLKPF